MKVGTALEYENSDGCDCGEDLGEYVCVDDSDRNDQLSLRSPIMAAGQEPEVPKLMEISLGNGDTSTEESLVNTVSQQPLIWKATLITLLCVDLAVGRY